MSKQVFKCNQCTALSTRRTILQDACPECGGEIQDVTETPNGQKFLSIIAMPVELRYGPLDNRQIYATGPSSLFSSNVGDQS
jgi:DNA polymerase II large subunit